MSTKTGFKYSELSKKAQEKAHEKYASSVVEVGDSGWESLCEDMNTQLEEYGIEIATKTVNRGNNRQREEFDFSYSGFWRQGDGASFTTNWFDPWKYIKASGQSKSARYAKLVDFYLKVEKYGDEFQVAGRVYRISSQSVHSKSVALDYEVNYTPCGSNRYTPKPKTIETASGIAEEVLNEMFEFCQKKMDEMYDLLEKDYVYQTSEKVAKEYFNDFDVRFDEDGNVL